MKEQQKYLLLASATITSVVILGLVWYLRKKSEKQEAEEDDDDEVLEFADLSASSVSSASFFTIEVSVPQHAVGAIIGKGGQNIRQLMKETGVRLEFNRKDDEKDKEEESEERILYIKGERERALKAEARVKEFIAEIPPIITKEFMVPQEACGRIIGKGGQNIRDICKTSGAKVEVERDAPATSKERKITITGTKVHVDYAALMVEEAVETHKAFLERNSQASEAKEQKKLERKKSVAPVMSEFPIVEIPDKVNFFQAFVSAFEKPDHFWIQPITEESQKLDTLGQDMTAHFNAATNEDENLQEGNVGDLCCAPFNLDDDWYRACITGFDREGNAELYYIDYGDTGSIPIRNIRQIRQEYLEIPAQAVECYLHGVTSSGEQWSEASINAFEELSHCAQWIPLMAQVQGYKNTREKVIPYVKLVDTSKEQDQDLAEELVRLGHANQLQGSLNDDKYDKEDEDKHEHENSEVRSPVTYDRKESKEAKELVGEFPLSENPSSANKRTQEEKVTLGSVVDNFALPPDGIISERNSLQKEDNKREVVEEAFEAAALQETEGGNEDFLNENFRDLDNSGVKGSTGATIAGTEEEIRSLMKMGHEAAESSAEIGANKVGTVQEKTVSAERSDIVLLDEGTMPPNEAGTLSDAVAGAGDVMRISKEVVPHSKAVGVHSDDATSYREGLADTEAHTSEAIPFSKKFAITEERIPTENSSLSGSGTELKNNDREVAAGETVKIDDTESAQSQIRIPSEEILGEEVYGEGEPKQEGELEETESNPSGSLLNYGIGNYAKIMLKDSTRESTESLDSEERFVTDTPSPPSEKEANETSVGYISKESLLDDDSDSDACEEEIMRVFQANTDQPDGDEERTSTEGFDTDETASAEYNKNYETEANGSVLTASVDGESKVPEGQRTTKTATEEGFHDEGISMNTSLTSSEASTSEDASGREIDGNKIFMSSEPLNNASEPSTQNGGSFNPLLTSMELARQNLLQLSTDADSDDDDSFISARSHLTPTFSMDTDTDSLSYYSARGDNATPTNEMFARLSSGESDDYDIIQTPVASDDENNITLSETPAKLTLPLSRDLSKSAPQLKQRNRQSPERRTPSPTKSKSPTTKYVVQVVEEKAKKKTNLSKSADRLFGHETAV